MSNMTVNNFKAGNAIVFILASFLLPLFVGCGNNSIDPALVGIWRSTDSRRATLELLENGTTKIFGGAAATWYVKEGRLYIVSNSNKESLSFDYEISGVMLTPTSDATGIETFRKLTAQEIEAETRALDYIRTLVNAVKSYQRDTGQIPTTEQWLEVLVNKPSDMPEGIWMGPYLSNVRPNPDPWGNAYQYRSPNRHREVPSFEIWSYGPDGIDDTSDDIGSWMLD